MGRPPCCDKTSVKRGLWTAEEDAKILAYISRHGTGNWTSVPKKAGLKRCGKSCRLRWTNYLRPDLKHDRFTSQEEDLIVNLHAAIGSRWSLIAAQLPGRTDNDVKNYWNTKLRKKLCEMGIDPVTHKPISQILADYGSISLPTTSKNSHHHHHHRYNKAPKGKTNNNNNVSCLNRDLRNAFMVKQEATHQICNTSTSTSTNNISTVEPAAAQEGLFVNPTWDLLAQLQAIKLVVEASPSCTNAVKKQVHHVEADHILTDNQQSEADASSFSWSDFLLEDVFLPQNHDHNNFGASSPAVVSYQDQIHQDMWLSSSSSSSSVSSSSSSSYSAAPQPTTEFMCNIVPEINLLQNHTIPPCLTSYGPSIYSESSGVYDDSFVDDLLDTDSQLLWDFPDILMDNPFHYS